MVGLKGQRALEQRRGPGRIVLHPLDLREVVGPPHLVRLEGGSFVETPAGGVEELGGHEEPAHFTVRGGACRRRCFRLPDLLLERCELLTQLDLHGRGRPGYIRELDGADGFGPSPGL